MSTEEKIEIEIAPFELMEWHRYGRITRGNLVYMKSGNVYSIDGKGSWHRVPKDNQPEIVFNFFHLGKKQEEEPVDPSLIVHA